MILIYLNCVFFTFSQKVSLFFFYFWYILLYLCNKCFETDFSYKFSRNSTKRFWKRQSFEPLSGFLKATLCIIDNNNGKIENFSRNFSNSLFWRFSSNWSGSGSDFQELQTCLNGYIIWDKAVQNFRGVNFQFGLKINAT